MRPLTPLAPLLVLLSLFGAGCGPDDAERAGVELSQPTRAEAPLPPVAAPLLASGETEAPGEGGPDARRAYGVQALRGTVVDEDERPLAAAEVLLWPIPRGLALDVGVERGGERRTETDLEGRFRFAGLRQGDDAYVMVRAAGRALHTQLVHGRLDEEEADLGVLPLAAGGHLVVQVRNSVREPLPGAEVYLWAPEFEATTLRALLPGEHGLPLLGTTDERGNFELFDARAHYRLGVTSPGRVASFIDGSLNGRGRTVELALLERGVSIAGTVLPGSAREGAGAAQAVGELTVVALRRRGLPAWSAGFGRLDIAADDRLAAYGRAASARVAADGSLELSGLPTREDGAPLGFLVCALDAEGAFAGSCALVTPEASDVVLYRGASTVLRARPVDASTGAPVELATLQLTRIFRKGDALEEEAEAPATLRLEPPELRDGRLELGAEARLAPGAYRLELTAEGYEDLTVAELELETLGTDLGPLALDPRPGVDVIVRWPGGYPAANVQVEARHFEHLPDELEAQWAGAPDDVGVTGADGRVRMFGHASGVSALIVRRSDEHAGGLPGRVYFGARGDAEDPLQLGVHRGGTITGSLVDREGDPLPGIVGLVPLEDYSAGDWGYLSLVRRVQPVGESGRFELLHVLPGNYVIQAQRLATAEERVLAELVRGPAPEDSGREWSDRSQARFVVKVVKVVVEEREPEEFVDGQEPVDQPRPVTSTLQRIVVVAEEDEVDVTLFPPELCNVTGRVFLDGEPLAKVAVLLGLGDAGTTTDEGGYFELLQVEPGRNDFYARPESGPPSLPIPVELPSGEAYVELDLGITATGRVVDAEGEGVPKAEVSLDQGFALDRGEGAGRLPSWERLADAGGLSAGRRKLLRRFDPRRDPLRTEEDGAFSIQGVQPDLALRVGVRRREEHGIWAFEPPGRDGAELGELVLLPPGDLVVDVVGPADGSWIYRLRRIGVMVVDEGELRQRPARFHNLQPGAYALVVSEGEGEAERELGELRVEVPAGRTTHASLAP